MQHISAIAVDFGSSNSGCARVYDKDSNGNIVFSKPDYLHALPNYVKDNTWFYVSPQLLERMASDYEHIKDSDLRIESRILKTENPNIIWTRETIKNNSQKLEEEHWTCFKQFKMLLYKGEDVMIEGCTLVNIIKTFLRILKIECLHIESERVERIVSPDEIEWGLTIPSIWTDDNKKTMVNIAHSVFSPVARVLSEPEGPLISNLLYSCGNINVPYQDGRTSLVVDLGGGTTDICLMQEVRQENGSYKFEMVDYTDGTNAGGNDIDHDFFVYLLRKISSGKSSDSGVVYDRLSDGELLNMLLEQFKSDVKGYTELEDNWLRLKEDRNLATSETCEFVFTSDYRKWLKRNGHSSLATAMVEFLVDGCELPSDEIQSRVLTPTFDRICKKIEEIIIANKDNKQIDKVVLAGGLSLNFMLVSRIKTLVEKILGSSNKVLTTPSKQAGAAILWGSCYLLTAGDFIVRKATRNYYYDVLVPRNEVIEILRNEYKKQGTKMRLGDLCAIEDDEKDKGYGILRDSNYLILNPIAIKGQPIINYSDKVSVAEGQKKMSTKLYSSDGKVILFANSDNPDLRHEGEIDIECSNSRHYLVEADLNEGQISNAIRCQIRDEETGEIVGEPFVIKDE